MRFISVISVTSAIFWAASAAPLPKDIQLSRKSVLEGSDVFAELDLTVRGPEEVQGSRDLIGFQPSEDPAERIAKTSGCVIA
ncbi:hypothetical protein C8R44DRAFT_819382 [Mycena epipterygia]|nr:hypothetical protein C8R44DRAFT_819382 [Mycena epipterygia]